MCLCHIKLTEAEHLQHIMVSRDRAYSSLLRYNGRRVRAGVKGLFITTDASMRCIVQCVATLSATPVITVVLYNAHVLNEAKE